MTSQRGPNMTWWPHVYISIVIAICQLLPQISTRFHKPPLILKNSGTLPVTDGEASIKFYITFSNSGSKVHIKPIGECCSMKPVQKCKYVLGLGKGAIVPSRSVYNVTYSIPKSHLTHKVRYCHFHLTHGHGQHLRHTVLFNATALFESKPHQSTSQESRYGRRKSVHHTSRVRPHPTSHRARHRCSGIDEDPSRACRPVNCVSKYGNHKPCYNHTLRRCQLQNTRLCFPKKFNKGRKTDSKEWISGNTSVKVNNIELEDKKLTPKENSLVKRPCSHGHWEPEFSACECDEGWRNSDSSAGPNHTNMLPMCNQRITDTTPEVPRPPANSLRNADRKNTTGDLDQEMKATLILLSLSSLFAFLVLAVCVWQKISECLPVVTKKISQGRPKVSEIGQRNCARVIRENSAIAEDELELRVGDVVTNMKKTSYTGWYEGSCNGLHGVFPVRCIMVYTSGDVRDPLSSDSSYWN